MLEENKNLEKTSIVNKIFLGIRKIFKWSGIFLIAIVTLMPAFLYLLYLLESIFRLHFLEDIATISFLVLLIVGNYFPSVLILGIILILIERIIKESTLTSSSSRELSIMKIVILVLVIFILIILLIYAPIFLRKIFPIQIPPVYD